MLTTAGTFSTNIPASHFYSPSVSRTSRSFCSPSRLFSSVSKVTGSVKSRELRVNISSALCAPDRSGYLHCSLTASSSCNSSTHWQIPELAPSLRPLLRYQVHSGRSSWGQHFESLPTSITAQSVPAFLYDFFGHWQPVALQTWKQKNVIPYFLTFHTPPSPASFPTLCFISVHCIHLHHAHIPISRHPRWLLRFDFSHSSIKRGGLESTHRNLIFLIQNSPDDRRTQGLRYETWTKTKPKTGPSWRMKTRLGESRE